MYPIKESHMHISCTITFTEFKTTGIPIALQEFRCHNLDDNCSRFKGWEMGCSDLVLNSSWKGNRRATLIQQDYMSSLASLSLWILNCGRISSTIRTWDQLRIAAAVPTFAILAWLLNSHWSAQFLPASYWSIQSWLDGSQYDYPLNITFKSG